MTAATPRRSGRCPPGVQDGDQEADGGPRRTPCRAQDGSDTKTEQAAMQRLRLDVRSGAQRLKGKQTATRAESNPTQTLTEMPHEVSRDGCGGGRLASR